MTNDSISHVLARHEIQPAARRTWATGPGERPVAAAENDGGSDHFPNAVVCSLCLAGAHLKCYSLSPNTQGLDSRGTPAQSSCITRNSPSSRAFSRTPPLSSSQACPQCMSSCYLVNRRRQPCISPDHPVGVGCLRLAQGLVALVGREVDHRVPLRPWHRYDGRSGNGEAPRSGKSLQSAGRWQTEMGGRTGPTRHPMHPAAVDAPDLHQPPATRSGESAPPRRHNGMNVMMNCCGRHTSHEPWQGGDATATKAS